MFFTQLHCQSHTKHVHCSAVTVSVCMCISIYWYVGVCLRLFVCVLNVRQITAKLMSFECMEVGDFQLHNFV